MEALGSDPSVDVAMLQQFKRGQAVRSGAPRGMEGLQIMAEATLQARTRGHPHLITLVVAAAVGTLALTMFIPSMPGMAEAFGTSYSTVQLALSLYLFMTALVQLACGPLSDLYGRRPVMIAGMGLFVAGTVICLLAPTIEWLLVGRVVQAASATGLILSRTIIRDLYERDKAASMIGYTVMAMAVAPMVGPWLGGLLEEAIGWRGTFYALLAVGIASLALVQFDLGETNRTAGQPVRAQLASYRTLVSTPAYWVFVGAGSFASAVFFGFLGGAPKLADVALQMSPASYGAWFAFCAAGYAVGNFVSGRFAERVGLARMILVGAMLSLSGPAAIALSFAVGWNAPFALFGWIALTGVGNGMVLPSNVAGAISIRPDAAGAASGLLGTLQTMTGALASVVAAWAVGDGTRALPFALVLLGAGLIGLVFAALCGRALRQ